MRHAPKDQRARGAKIKDEADLWEDSAKSDRVAHAQKVELITKSNRKMIATMRGLWDGWHESIPNCWAQCAIVSQLQG